MTGNGIYLRWEKAELEELPYLKKGEYKAVRTEDHLLIPKLGLVLKETAKGHWENGPFKAVRVKNETHTRMVENSGDTHDALRKEMNARLQYVLEIIQSPKAKLDYLCDVYNEVRRLEHLEADSLCPD